MSDALGPPPRPPRPPGPGVEAGAGGQQRPRPTQPSVQRPPNAGVGNAGPSIARQVGPSSGAVRLASPATSFPAGVRLVGTMPYPPSPLRTQAVVSVDSPAQQQLDNSWMNQSSNSLSTNTPPRRTLVTTVSTPPSIAPILSSPSSLLRPLPSPASPFVTPILKRQLPMASTPPTSPTTARKRLKMDEEEQEELPVLRRRVLSYRANMMRSTRDVYTEMLAELFFLQAGGNMMDYYSWRKRPTPPYLEYQRGHKLEGEELETISQDSELRLAGPGATPVAVSTQLPAAVMQLNQQGQVPGRPQGGRHGMVFAPRVAPGQSPASQQAAPSCSPSVPPKTPAGPSTSTTLIPGGVSLVPDMSGSPVPSSSAATSSSTAVVARPSTSTASTSRPSPATPGPSQARLSRLPIGGPMARQHTRQHSISAVYDTSIGSQEQIVEKAKQEAYVMQRVSELQREGLWSERRLPKVQEPPRAKAHWDYLLEEMVWLAADFAQERKWKKAAAKKCAKMVQKYFQDKAVQAQKAEKNHELRLRKIASFYAKEVKTFWGNAQKLVEYKHNTILEERRRQALDQHLSFIVDQTEKYSSMLAESMSKGGQQQQSRPESKANSLALSANSRVSSPDHQAVSDGEFEPNQSSSDDEETIAHAEAEDAPEEQSEELKLLKMESELTLDDLIKSLPVEVREAVKRGEAADFKPKEEGVEGEKADDVDFHSSEEDSSDDEVTIQEQEKAEKDEDHKQELKELEELNSMTREELLAKFGGAPSESTLDSKSEQASEEEESDEDGSTDEEDSDDQDEDEDMSIEEGDEDEDEESEDLSSENEEDSTKEIGLSSLLEDGSSKKGIDDFNELAASAEKFQPKGNTLSSTTVVTEVPFLLKHTLREYQHIGLEWLVTMFDRKLNGILADEMGLGKTIQTIALLAHLACAKCIWGPHLIIVPTSVMLNWEMEFKKWCPAFKILTYYGNQKERKQKRTGWTKPNAFHVCITSYKLVIQDHQSFRRKKWRYLILDEAQNIKNFKSQRWQLLLNFQSQRRLLLTGTPLQNSLMELWSLMHFLMPNVFQSHREFKEWFSNPVTGMIEGNSEYNESIIKRLHKVLRPFLLRRLKAEVERQLPKKYEHVVMCRLSKRQRFLYDDFMSRAKTRETLASGNLLSVINVLMQLRKVCNHPNLFEVRPTISPFQMEGLTLRAPSLACNTLEYDPLRHISLQALNLLRVEFELNTTAYTAHRIRKYATPRRLIEEIDSQPSPPPLCPRGKIRFNVRSPASNSKMGIVSASPGTSPILKNQTGQQNSAQGVMLRVTGGSQTQGYSVQLVQHAEGVRAIPVTAHGSSQISNTTGAINTVATQPTATTATGRTAVTMTSTAPTPGLETITSVVQRIPRPAGFAQLVQTATGKHILLTSSPQPIHHTPTVAPGASTTNATGRSVLTSAGHRLTVLSKPASGVITTTVTPLNKVLPNANNPPTTSAIAPNTVASGRPVMRVPPLNMANASSTTKSQTTSSTSLQSNVVKNMPQNASVIHTRTLDARLLAMAENVKKSREQPQQPQSIFHLPELEDSRRRERRAKLCSLATINQSRCGACPLYGADLVEALTMLQSPSPPTTPFSPFLWSGGAGMVHCLRAQNLPRDELWTCTQALSEVILDHEERVDQLRDVFSRFVMYVPPVNAPRIRLHASHPSPSKEWAEQRLVANLCHELSPRTNLLHPVASAMATQFPDPRLIQYDCGKLQVLQKLLRQLKYGSHRVLIFTQMTRMLDVLEAFLNHQGHIYLRLDGSTKVDQRQVLMERFNADRRIFAFILSTRSGGIGVNLTGADTVVFYDSDWNPTMDAQAQDRCHRIGQTRDVHIYRLVSEKTVEENILKKANQKRLLGDLAIEGGNFTTAYFKSSTIQELFNVDTNENDASRRMAEVLDVNAERERNLQKAAAAREQEVDAEAASPSSAPPEERVAMGVLESALAAAEDEPDVQAARTARAEAAAELAEFDENIALEDSEAPQQQPSQQATAGEELSRAEQEVQSLVEKLTPVERYAMRVVEQSESVCAAEQLAAAEAEIEQQKREWELGRLRAMQERGEEEERLSSCASPSDMLTYSSRDAHAQVWVSRDGLEKMPMWCPPTPPQEEGDVYVDMSLGFLYEHSIMSEAELPPVYVRREHKRARTTSTGCEREGRRPLKLRRTGEDNASTFHSPRSLFDRPVPALVKMRRDLRMQKFRGGNLANSLSRSGTLLGFSPQGLPITRPQGMVRPPSSAPQPESVPEWMIHEDWALLQAVQSLQELTLGLIVVMPGHTPNWDMVADMVNAVSRTHRSAKQCRSRYEAVIVPREEGKIQHDPSPKKPKKQKGIYKTPQTKGGRALRTSQLYIQDNGSNFTQLFVERFDIVANVASRRVPTNKPLLVNPNLRNPKHAAVLAESGIIYDVPLAPLDVAQRRAERISREKLKNQQVAATQSAAEQLAVQRLQQQTASSSAVKNVVTAVSSTNTQSSLSTPLPPATLLVALSQSSLSPQTQTMATSHLSSSTVVATQQSQPHSAAVVSVAGGTTVLQAPTTSNLSPQLRVPRSNVTTLTVQEMVATANRVSRAGGGTQVVSVAQLNPAQAQRLASASLVATPTSAAVAKAGVKAGTISGKGFSALDFQVLLQQQALLQQQRQQAMKLQAGQAGTATVTTPVTALASSVVGQKMSVGVATPSTSGTIGVAALQVGQQRSPQQYLKQGALGKPTAVTRTLSEAERAAFIKRQQHLQQQKAAAAAAASSPGVAGQVAQVQLPAQAGMSSQQILPQTVQVKTAMAGGSKVGTASQQQLRQLTLHQLHQRQQKVTGKAGVVPTQVILQGQKSLPAKTMQQLQLFKQATGQVAPGTTQVLSHTVLAKSGQGSGQTLQTRVIPVTGGQQQIKQTIQVVTAAPGQTLSARPANPLLTFDSSGRQQVSVTLASALGGSIKMTSAGTVTAAQQQAIISGVTAALCQQNLAARQAMSPSHAAVRISAPAIAAAVAQQQRQQQAAAAAAAAAAATPTTSTASATSTQPSSTTPNQPRPAGDP